MSVLIRSGTFTETSGAIFFRKRTPEHQILETLALLAEGNPISSLTRAKGYKEDTVLEWLRDSAAHSKQVEAVLAMAAGLTDHIWTVKERLL